MNDQNLNIAFGILCDLDEAWDERKSDDWEFPDECVEYCKEGADLRDDCWECTQRVSKLLRVLIWNREGEIDRSDMSIYEFINTLEVYLFIAAFGVLPVQRVGESIDNLMADDVSEAIRKSINGIDTLIREGMTPSKLELEYEREAVTKPEFQTVDVSDLELVGV